MSGPDLLQAGVSGLLMGGIFALIAIGISLIWGVMDMINFAYAEFVMLAMYASYLAHALLGLDPLLFLPVNAALFFLVGVGLYWGIIRRVLRSPPIAQIFCTFGLLILLRYLAFFVWGPDVNQIRSPYSDRVLYLGPIGVELPQLVAFGASLAITGLMFAFVEWTKAGRGLRATAQDREAALAVGVSVERMFGLAWGLSLGLAAAAGSLLSTFFYIFPFVGDVFLLVAFAAVALGGFGNMHGACVGGLIIGVVEVVGGSLFLPALKYVYVYIIFVAVLFLRPAGLFGR
jgi:branched-chain amino acid transport system permease protein